jgi:hypothetical protein
LKIAFFFLGILLLGLSFEFAEQMDAKWGKIDLFYLRDEQWNPSSYVYFAGESLAYIALASFAMHLVSKIPTLSPYRHFVLIFIVLESIDLVDFFFSKSGLWFEYRGYPITYNIVKVLIFILVIIYEYAWDYITSYPTGDEPGA